MSDFIINDFILKAEAREIAAEADRVEHFEGSSAEEFIDDVCNGHEWTIYTYKALRLCAECDTNHGEQYTDDIGEAYKCFPDHVAAIAYGTLLGACHEALAEIRSVE